MKIKFLAAILVVTLAIFSNASAKEEYTRSNATNAGKGALVGLAFGGMFGGAMGLAFGSAMGDLDGGDAPASQVAQSTVTGVLIGGAIGAGIGALVGSGVKKKHNYAVTPILDPNPKSPSAGVDLSLNF